MTYAKIKCNIWITLLEIKFTWMEKRGVTLKTSEV